MSASASARLGDFVEILSGFAFDAANFSDEGDIALIRIRDVLRGRSNTFYSGEYDEKYLINEGEILIGMDGEFNRARWQSAPALLNQRVCKISSNSPRLADEYLFHFLPAALKSIEDATSFVTVKHLSAKQIRDIAIPLPPVEEQRRIAAILDQAETLRTQRRQALAHLDTLTQSLFLDMFGDPATNPKCWPVGHIRDLLESASYGTSEKSSSEGEFPVLRMNNLTRTGELDLSDLKYMDLPLASRARYLALPGDVLFNRTNSAELVGKTAMVPADAPQLAYAGYLVRLRVNHDNEPIYLARFLNSAYAKQMLRSMCKSIVGMANINAKEIQAMKIALPPLALQQTFATRIQAIEALKATHRTALAQLDALFASLQQRAFAGKLTAQASSTVAKQPAKRSFAELGQLDAPKGVESLVYAAKRLRGKGHYWPTKAQYFADKRHLELYGRSIYGETYVAMDRGPVPQAAYNASRALAEGELICEFPMDVVRVALRREGNELIALRDADAVLLSAKERECLDWAIRYVRDMSFDQLQTASHDAAWQKTATNASMTWEDIVRTLPEAAQRRFFM